jgi:hypothetical protein
MPNPNLGLLQIAAKLLLPMLDELVFVGGCATGLLITEEAAGEVRPTVDVDVIAEITSFTEYYDFSERLRSCGFREDASPGAPLCRWLHGETKVDVMPLDEKILGFSNPWYVPAMQSATTHEIEKGLEVKVITAPYFCATKFEAFRGRGKGEYLGNHDLEDIVTVLDGRPELLQDLEVAPEDVSQYVVNSIAELVASPKFLDALPGYLMPDEASQMRAAIVLNRMQRIIQL